jgi:hypothetical protein
LPGANDLDYSAATSAINNKSFISSMPDLFDPPAQEEHSEQEGPGEDSNFSESRTFESGSAIHDEPEAGFENGDSPNNEESTNDFEAN